MKTTIHWREQGPGVVTISQGGFAPARLFGAPFAAAGLYFLYIFLGGVLHPSEMTIAGWLLLPVITAAFLVPGWILLFGRKRTRLDASRREATEEFDFLVFTRRTTTAIGAQAHVMLRFEVGSRRTVKGAVVDSGVTSYDAHVYLVPQDGGTPQGKRSPTAGPVLLAVFPSTDKAAALELAQRVGRFLTIGIKDLCFERGEVTSGGVVVERLDPEEAD